MSFAPRSEADLLQLIEEYPLAWVVSSGGPGFGASALPLLAETDPHGRIVSLLGHFALSNPHVAMLREDPQATILFMGPQGYVSPAVVSQPGWAPTWNYASVQFNVEIELLPQENAQALEKLVHWMERDRREPWTISRMGSRYDVMVTKIVAFRGHVRSTRGRFKLGQDESPQTRREMLGRLVNADLVRWMARFDSLPEEPPLEKR